MLRLTLTGFAMLALLASTRAHALGNGPRSTQTYDIRVLLVPIPDLNLPIAGSAQIDDRKKPPVLTRAQLAEQLVN
jgi:hypothetical protein